MNDLPRKSSLQDDRIHSITLGGSKVIGYKLGEISMNGEFMAHFETNEGKFYFCNCEYRKKGVHIHTQTEITKESFEKPI